MKDHLHNKEFFTVLFSPRTITGALVQYTSTEGLIRFISVVTIPLHHLQLERLALFNPTQIGKRITKWYSACKKNVPILFALHGPTIEEHVIPMHTPHPNLSQLPISHAPHLLWKHTYLYSLDHRHYFYICGIPKALLFQYQLLAISHQLPLTLLTTERMALTHCYRHLYGSAYRQTQLAQSMHEHNNHIERLFHKEDLSRIAQLPPNLILTDTLKLQLLTACGLYSMQGKMK